MIESSVLRARQTLDVRLRRAEFFKPELFDELDWDLMLVLFIAGEEGRRLSRPEIKRAIPAGDAALERWIHVLMLEDIVEEIAGGPDLGLSPLARRKMHRLLSDPIA